MSLTFEIDDHAPSLVRGFIGDVLNAHPRRTDVLVAVSELVTNVIRHAPATGQASIVLDVNGDHLRIGVRQIGRIFVPPAAGDATEPHGRGLLIVEALADRWGVDVSGETVEVWFEMVT